jgi:hypothetical protein
MMQTIQEKTERITKQKIWPKGKRILILKSPSFNEESDGVCD